MTKLNITILLLFALSIKPSFGRQCYACSTEGAVVEFESLYPKGVKGCKHGLGMKVECSGSCVKQIIEGYSNTFYKLNTYHFLF